MSEDQVLEQFFGLGLQYYAAGRFAALAGLGPVAGNLLHRAVEMLLKGQLSRKRTLAELKKTGHKLTKLWGQFKQDATGSDVERFAVVIKALDRFEAIRYPDRIVSRGMFCTISVSGPRPDPAWVKGSTQPPTYGLVLDDVDRLVKTIFETSRVNPRFYSGMIRRDARVWLKRYNKWRIDI